MQTFFINIFVAVLTNPKVEALLGKLIDQAMVSVKADITAKIDNTEALLLNGLKSLPEEILGDAEKTVESIVGVVPGQVKSEVQPLFSAIQIPGLDVQALANEIAAKLNPLNWGR